MRPTGEACPECGAHLREGMTCRELFEQLLVFEYEHPESYGKAHFFTVACYNLQHPSGFTPSALDWLAVTLRRAVTEKLSPEEIRRLARNELPQKEKITRKPGDGNSQVPRGWKMTVADIRTDNPEDYAADISAWANAILSDLERLPPGPGEQQPASPPSSR